MDEYRARIDRLERWRENSSYGLAVSRDSYQLNDLIVASIALIETLYPLNEAGETQLDWAVDPQLIDDWRAIPDRLVSLNESLQQVRKTGTQRHLSWRKSLSELHINTAGPRTYANKPFGVFYTSSANQAFPGMWFLHLAARDSPEGLTGWTINGPSKKSISINSAVGWCQFAYRFLDGSGNIVWTNVAKEYWSVTVSALAVVKIDCFEFAFQGRLISPVYWGVETTVWLTPEISVEAERAAQ